MSALSILLQTTENTTNATHMSLGSVAQWAVVVAVLIGCAGWIVWKVTRKRDTTDCGCGCGCDSCPSKCDKRKKS